MSLKQEHDKQRLLKQLERYPIVEIACKKANVSRATFYRWRKADDVFAEACDEAIDLSAGYINDLAETQLVTAIKERNMTAIMFWLKHHHRSYTTRVELDARVRHESQALTDDQAAQVAQALRLAGILPEFDDGRPI